MNKKNLINLLNIKSIFIFDFDGVIVNSNMIKALNFYKIFDVKNIRLKKKIINFHNKNIGISRYKKIKFFIDNFDELKNFRNKEKYFADKFKKLCIKDISNCNEIPGALKYIKGLYNQKNQIILCSATPLAELITILKKRKIYKYFNKIYGHPIDKQKTIEKLLNKKNTNPKKFVYFGDSNNDYVAARENNIDFIHVKSNKNFTYNNKKIIVINDFNF